MGFDPLPETKAVRAPNRLAGSGTHRQECLTRRESAAIHDYPRATGPNHRFAKALLIEHFSPELSPRSWWIAPRRSGVRVPLAPLSRRPCTCGAFVVSGVAMDRR